MKVKEIILHENNTLQWFWQVITSPPGTYGWTPTILTWAIIYSVLKAGSRFIDVFKDIALSKKLEDPGFIEQVKRDFLNTMKSAEMDPHVAKLAATSFVGNLERAIEMKDLKQLKIVIKAMQRAIKEIEPRE